MKAFPNGIITNGDGLIIGGQQGMDLRDWFAGLAMQGLLANEQTKPDSFLICKASYAIASAMMEERQIK